MDTKPEPINLGDGDLIAEVMLQPGCGLAEAIKSLHVAIAYFLKERECEQSK